MAWYRSGSISVTNGSATVTGSGTQFVANVGIGQGLIAPDGRTYEIANVVSNTQLTLAGPYLGASASAQGYAIIPTQSYMQDLATGVANLIASFAAVRDGAGQGLFGNGSVTEPGIRFSSDQDTGFIRPASNALGVVLGGVERWRFSENVWLSATGEAAFGTGSVASFGVGQTTVQAKGNNANYTGRGGIFRSTSQDGTCEAFYGVRADYTPSVGSLSNHPFVVYTNNSERARFDTAGNLLVGKTSVGSGGDGAIVGAWSTFTRTNGAPMAIRRDSTDGAIIDIIKNGAAVGSISVTGTSTAYNTASDARLKYDIEDATDASALIDDIRIRTFRWNADDSVERYGVIAQELVEVAPEAVTGSPDSEEMMAVDFSKLVPMLIKEVQSLRGRLAGQEAAMASLEARLAALEAA